MNAEIRDILTIDSDLLETYQPVETDNFSVWVRVIAGPSNTMGAESFDIMVASSDSSITETVSQPTFVKKGVLVVPTYDYQGLETFLRGYFESVHGRNWQEIGTRLSEWFLWEFDNWVENQSL